MNEPYSPQVLIEQFLPGQFAERFEQERVVPLGVSSASVVLRVVGVGPWSVRVLEGRLVAERGADEQCALQISVAEQDFAALVEGPLRRHESTAQRFEADPERLKRWDDETVGLLRAMRGGVLLKVQDGERHRCIAVTPGAQPFDLANAECTIECQLDDFYQLQAGTASPINLLSEGSLRLTGDAQIAMGLGSLFLF